MARASVAAGFASLVIMGAIGAAAAGPSHAVAMRVTTGPGQVLAMAVYSSISTIGGFCGPFVVGVLLGQDGGFIKVCSIMGSVMLACGVMTVAVKQLAAWRDKRLLCAAGGVWSDDADSLPVSSNDSGTGLSSKDVCTGVSQVTLMPRSAVSSKDS